MNIKDFIGPLFGLALIALGYYLLRTQRRSDRLPTGWRATLLEHEAEQERHGHTYGTRSVK